MKGSLLAAQQASLRACRFLASLLPLVYRSFPLGRVPLPSEPPELALALRPVVRALSSALHAPQPPLASWLSASPPSPWPDSLLPPLQFQSSTFACSLLWLTIHSRGLG